MFLTQRGHLCCMTVFQRDNILLMLGGHTRLAHLECTIASGH